jgi:hypothetical protein
MIDASTIQEAWAEASNMADAKNSKDDKSTVGGQGNVFAIGGNSVTALLEQHMKNIVLTAQPETKICGAVIERVPVPVMDKILVLAPFRVGHGNGTVIDRPNHPGQSDPVYTPGKMHFHAAMAQTNPGIPKVLFEVAGACSSNRPAVFGAFGFSERGFAHLAPLFFAFRSAAVGITDLGAVLGRQGPVTQGITNLLAHVGTTHGAILAVEFRPADAATRMRLAAGLNSKTHTQTIP